MHDHFPVPCPLLGKLYYSGSDLLTTLSQDTKATAATLSVGECLQGFNFILGGYSLTPVRS